MTETIEREAITEALGLIDQNLGRMQRREVISADEMSDLLLDLRMALAAADSEAQDVETADV